MINNPPQDLLSFSPIGYIKTEMQAKFDAPHQPSGKDEEWGLIELSSDPRMELGLLDLDGFSHIWLIWWFHRNNSWRAKVLPPRGPEKRRGVFATRSPHRPNPIGITAVKLIKIEKNKIYIGSHDLVNGTPILDIKPYLPKVDSISDAKTGWIAEVEDLILKTPEFQIEISERAKSQLDWLATQKINFIDRAIQLLSIDPTPHRTRRIKKLTNEQYRMGCGGWRIFFSLIGSQVLIEKISPGYPKSSLIALNSSKILNFNEQIKFYELWGAEIE